MTELLINFLLLSATINGLMEGLKKTPVANLKFYKEWKSLWPHVIGAALGTAIGMYMGHYWLSSLAGGILAGAMATSSYDILKDFLRKKADVN